MASDAGNSNTAAEHLNITLNDRVAFGCRFLVDSELPGYLATTIQEATEEGRIDGIMLTGLTPDGAVLTQHYLDRTGDVQTAAVVGCYLLRVAQLGLAAAITSRYCGSGGSTPTGVVEGNPAADAGLLPYQWQRTVTRAWRWIQGYRELLTRSTLWHERAKFDVMRSKLLNVQYKGYTPPAGRAAATYSAADWEHEAFAALLALATTSAAAPPSAAGGADTAARATGPVVSGSGSVGSGSGDEADADGSAPAAAVSLSGTLALGPTPSQMYVRCVACRTSLSLPALVEGSVSSVDWLSKQKPHMLACPACRKQLPRWYVFRRGRATSDTAAPHPTGPTPHPTTHIRAAPSACCRWGALTPCCSCSTK